MSTETYPNHLKGVGKPAFSVADLMGFFSELGEASVVENPEASKRLVDLFKSGAGSFHFGEHVYFVQEGYQGVDFLFYRLGDADQHVAFFPLPLSDAEATELVATLEHKDFRLAGPDDYHILEEDLLGYLEAVERESARQRRLG
jgi:hypothetical protein